MTARRPLAPALVLLGALLGAGILGAQPTGSAVGSRDLPIVQRRGSPYVRVEDLARVLGLTAEATPAGAVRIVGSSPRTRDVVVELWPQDPIILVDEREELLTLPPLEEGGSLLVPLEEIESVLLPDGSGLPRREPSDPPAGLPEGPALAPADPAAAFEEGARLLGMAYEFEEEWTQLRYVFDRPPDYRVVQVPGRAALELTVPGGRKHFREQHVAIQSSHVTEVTFADEGPQGLISSVFLRGETSYDYWLDRATNQVMLRVTPPREERRTYEPEAFVAATRSWTSMGEFARSRPVILDPGHGGEDVGLMVGDLKESALTLAVARKVQTLLERGGFRARMTRDDDVSLALEDRLEAIHGAGVGLVLSFHVEGSRFPEVSGTRIVVPAPSVVPSTMASFADQRGPWGPSPAEAEAASSCARALAASIQSITGREVEVSRGAGLIPVSRVHDPGLVMDLGHLTHPVDRQLLGQEAFRDAMAHAVYAGVHAFYRESFLSVARPGAEVLELLPWSADGGLASPAAPDASALPPAPDEQPGDAAGADVAGGGEELESRGDAGGGMDPGAAPGADPGVDPGVDPGEGEPSPRDPAGDEDLEPALPPWISGEDDPLPDPGTEGGLPPRNPLPGAAGYRPPPRFPREAAPRRPHAQPPGGEENGRETPGEGDR